VHMVILKLPFLNPALPLGRQFPEYRAQFPSKLSEQHFPPAFRDKYDMVFAFPLRVF
jgi:hypothetical protein